MEVIKDTDALTNDALKLFLSRWLEKKDGSKIPTSECVDKNFLESLEPYCKHSIALSPFDVKYTCVGSAIKKWYKEDMEDKSINELFDPWFRKIILESYELCAQKALPVYDNKGVSTIIGSIGYEYLILPFSDNGQTVTSFITCLFPLGIKPGEAEDWEQIIKDTPWFNK